MASLPFLCSSADETPVTGSQVTKAEITELAEKYLENNPRIMEPLIPVERKEAEDVVGYLGRVISYEIASFNDSMAKVFKQSGIVSAFNEVTRLSDIVKENSALSTLKGFHTATDNLQAALKDVECFKVLNSPAMSIYDDLRHKQALYDSVIPQYLLEEQKTQDMMKSAMGLPTWASLNPEPPVPRFNIADVAIPQVRNPIHTTNEKLDDLTERMDAFTETLAGHIEVSAIALQEVAKEIKTGSKGTWSQNWVAIVIAALSLIVALAGYFKDSFKSAPAPKPLSAGVTVPADKALPVPKKPVVPQK